MVGDGLRDLQAGAAAGCEPHLVLTGKGAELAVAVPLPPRLPRRTPRSTKTLAAFADWLIAAAQRAAPKASA